MRALLLLTLIFSSITSQAFVKNADAYADQIVWDALMDQLSKEGELAHTIFGEMRSFTKIINIEKDKSHRAIYLTAAGIRTMEGEYIVQQVSVTTELWTLMEDGKTWYIDQWFYYYSSKGVFRYSVHNIIEKEGITIKKLEKSLLGPIEQQVAMGKELLSVWY